MAYTAILTFVDNSLFLSAFNHADGNSFFLGKKNFPDSITTNLLIGDDWAVIGDEADDLEKESFDRHTSFFRFNIDDFLKDEGAVQTFSIENEKSWTSQAVFAIILKVGIQKIKQYLQVSYIKSFWINVPYKNDGILASIYDSVTYLDLQRKDVIVRSYNEILQNSWYRTMDNNAMDTNEIFVLVGLKTTKIIHTAMQKNLYHSIDMGVRDAFSFPRMDVSFENLPSKLSTIIESEPELLEKVAEDGGNLSFWMDNQLVNYRTDFEFLNRHYSAIFFRVKEYLNEHVINFNATLPLIFEGRITQTKQFKKAYSEVFENEYQSFNSHINNGLISAGSLNIEYLNEFEDLLEHDNLNKIGLVYTTEDFSKIKIDYIAPFVIPLNKNFVVFTSRKNRIQ